MDAASFGTFIKGKLTQYVEDCASAILAGKHDLNAEARMRGSREALLAIHNNMDNYLNEFLYGSKK